MTELEFQIPSDEDLALRVKHGVAWLDENVSDWRNRVEVKQLDLTSTCHCVLGQVFAEEADESIFGGGYIYARVAYLNDDRLTAAELGFDTDTHLREESDRQFAKLQELWTAVLTEK